MKCVGQVEAIPPAIDCLKENEACLRLDPHCVQNDRKWHAPPFGNRRPSLLANVLCDLSTCRKALQLRQRKLSRLFDQTIDSQAPLHKTVRNVGTIEIVAG